jgi:DNA-binding IscR family transcriptional regulator
MIQLNDSQEEVLHSIIDAYELEEAEGISVFDVAKRSGISEELAERILVQLEGLKLVKRNEVGVIIEADNNGYNPFII